MTPEKKLNMQAQNAAQNGPLALFDAEGKRGTPYDGSKIESIVIRTDGVTFGCSTKADAKACVDWLGAAKCSGVAELEYDKDGAKATNEHGLAAFALVVPAKAKDDKAKATADDKPGERRQVQNELQATSDREGAKHGLPASGTK